MRTIALGDSTLLGSRLAYGCWRLVNTWDPSRVTDDAIVAGERAVLAAYEAGYTVFDNADIYCHGVCETVFGRAMRNVRGMRERVVVVTKCGIRFAGDPVPDAPGRYDFSADYIARSIEGSLRRLQVDHVDLLLLHRPDYLMNPSEVARAFNALRQQGKVREFGVSNFRPSQVAALQRACPMKLLVNQVEVHLGKLDALEDGTLDQCLAEGITPMSWSPLGGGLLAEGPANAFADSPLLRNVQAGLVETLDAVAREVGASRATVALAWLLKHPAGIMPVVGSINAQRIQDATRADVLELSREQWYRILIAARGEPLP